MALSSLGEYKKAEEAHWKAIQIDQKFLEAWGHLAQFYQDLANSEKALDCLDPRFVKGYHLRGLLLHAMGDHRNAIKDLSVGLSIESSNIECLYLRASCHHAVGEYKEAVKDYDSALDLELDSMDKFVLQCLAFYQKEIALYTSAKVNSEFSWFDIDTDVDPMFKELGSWINFREKFRLALFWSMKHVIFSFCSLLSKTTNKLLVNCKVYEDIGKLEKRMLG